MFEDLDDYLFKWAVCEPDEEKCKDCDEVECEFYDYFLEVKNERNN